MLFYIQNEDHDLLDQNIIKVKNNILVFGKKETLKQSLSLYNYYNNHAIPRL